MISKTILLILLLLIGSIAAQWNSFSAQTFNCPPFSASQGINNKGVICSGYAPTKHSYPYVPFQNSTLTSFYVPDWSAYLCSTNKRFEIAPNGGLYSTQYSWNKEPWKIQSMILTDSPKIAGDLCG